MNVTHLIPIVALSAAACLSNPALPLSPAASAPSPQATESTQLRGFVELYAEEGSWLLSNGQEIRLEGATEQVQSFAGLQVVVSGRFVGDRLFRVDRVARVHSPALAVAARNR